MKQPSGIGSVGGRLNFFDVVWLWRSSGFMFDDAAWVDSMKLRTRFMLGAVRHRAAVVPFLRSSGALARALAQRPQLLGVVVWPYQCLSWEAPTRLQRIREHWLAVETEVPLLNFPPNDAIDLIQLNDLMPGLRLVLDQSMWFMREGQLVLNLFIAETRVFSLAFSLRKSEVLTAYLGAIQGRSIEGALEIYRDMTHAMSGMRPRDFLVELFRMLCASIGVKTILAVSDASRHHRHPYFGNKFNESTALNYDEIWRERGGSVVDEDFFSLPIDAQRRSLESISSKKRSMYRARYENLARIETELNTRLKTQSVS